MTTKSYTSTFDDLYTLSGASVFLDGRNGGQTINGDTAPSGNLVLSSTSDPIKGTIFFDTNISIQDDNLVLPNTAGNGIKLETSSPIFGWRDIIGEVKVLSPGASDPSFAVFRDSLRQFSFSNVILNEVFVTFHIPHDYVPGSDIFIHAHWAQNVVDTGGPAGAPGDVKWQFEVSYAKGHNQSVFPASITTYVIQTASNIQYQHLIAEVQLSSSSPTGLQIDSNILEVDGIILVRAFRDPGDASDTLDKVPFFHYCDIHYQSTNIATKGKSPDFWT